MYELRIKKASNQFGGGEIVATIYYNGKFLATIGCGTEEEARTIFDKFLKGR